MAVNESKYYSSLMSSVADVRHYWKLSSTTNAGSLTPADPITFVGGVSFELGHADPTDSCLVLPGEVTAFARADNAFSLANYPSGSSFALEFWFNPAVEPETKFGSNDTRNETIVSVQSFVDPSRDIYVFLDPLNRLSLSHGNSVIAQSSRNLKADTWNHVLVVFEVVSGNWKVHMYLNGYMGDESVILTSTHVTRTVFVGGVAASAGALVSSATEVPFRGKVDELAIYSGVPEVTHVQRRVERHLYNLDHILATQSLEKEIRVRRFDVSWGLPKGAITYRRSKLSSNPMGYWKMDASVGIIRNLGWTRSSNNGAVTGPLVSEKSFVDPSDSALRFVNTAVNQVDCGNVQFVGSYRFSFEAWVRVDSSASPVIVAANNSTGTVFEWALRTAPSGGNVFVELVVNNAAPVITTSTTALTPNRLNHVVCVVTGSAHQIYVNGKLAGSSVSTVLPVYDAASRLVLGRSNGGTLFTSMAALSGVLDEVCVYDYPVSALPIAESYALGINARVIEPAFDIDTSPVFLSGEEFSYADQTTALAPLHYWDLTQPPTNSLPNTGIGTHPKPNLRYRNEAGMVLVNSTTTPSPTAGFTTATSFGQIGAPTFIGSTVSEVGQNLGLNKGLSTASRTPFSCDFWFRREGPNRHPESIVAIANTSNLNDRIFHVFQQNGRIFLEVMGNRLYRWEVAPDINMGDWRQPAESWYYFAVTIDEGGLVRFFVDGKQTFVNRIEDGRGLFVPATATYANYALTVARQIFDDVERIGIQHLGIFDKSLAPFEIVNRFQIGKLGTGFSTRIISSDPTAPTDFEYPVSEYASLRNGRDITGNVVSFNITSDIGNIVDTAMLEISEEWDVSMVSGILPPNTYVILEERYSDSTNKYDSGWLSLGHFLVDGPIGTVVGEGTKAHQLGLRSALKIASFDPFPFDIAPDKLFVERGPMTFAEAGPDFFKFKRSKPSGGFFVNWAELPPLKLWVTNFQNFDSSNDEDVARDELIQIRGADGAILTLGGEGSIVISQKFYNDRISQRGLGNPNRPPAPGPNAIADGVLAEFHRYATIQDTNGGIYSSTVRVNSIAYSGGRWVVGIGTAGQIDSLAGKTVFVKTGNARGKMFRAVGLRELSSDQSKAFTSATVDNVVAVYSPAVIAGSSVWQNPANAITASVDTASWVVSTQAHPSGTRTTANDLSPRLLFRALPSSEAIPASDTILGLEFFLVHSTRVFKNADRHLTSHHTGFQQVNGFVSTHFVGFCENTGGVNTTVNRSNPTKRWIDLESHVWQSAPIISHSGFDTSSYGSNADLWGQAPGFWTPARVNHPDFGFHVQLQAVYTHLRLGNPWEGLTPDPSFNTVFIKHAYARVYTNNATYLLNFSLSSVDGRAVSPLEEGLNVGDEIQVGDANTLEDAIRKFLLYRGFQENNSALPFYFQLDKCFAEVQLPPLRYNLEATQDGLEPLSEIMQYAPPNYILYHDRNGVIRTKNLIVNNDVEPYHALDTTTDQSQDASDYGVFTKVIAFGEGGSGVNVGLHADFGGWSSVRTYKLDDHSSGSTNADGINLNANIGGVSVSLPTANQRIRYIFDGSASTQMGTFNGFRYPGVLWQRIGTRVKPWIFDYAPDLFCLDIGLNQFSNLVTEFEVGRLEYFWMETYPEGNKLPQTMEVWYMTEHDFIAEFGYSPPTIPSQASADLGDAGYMPPHNARSWKLLLREFSLSEGQNTLESGEFETGKPTKLRFLKFTVGSPSYRFSIAGRDNNARFARIVIPDIKVWTSTRIIASAELGVDGLGGVVLATGSEKLLASRLRRRTILLPPNPFIDTYDQAKEFAKQELLERIKDFRPLAVTAIAPTVRAGDIVSYMPLDVAKGTHTHKNYIVTSSQYNSSEESCDTRLVLSNYDL